MTAQKSNSNTVWFNFQTYIIFSINLVSQVTLRSSGTDILHGCHLLRSTNIYFILKIFPEKTISSLDTHVMYLNRNGGGISVYFIIISEIFYESEDL